MYRRVALLGFMGAGKTTVGRLLAPMLGWRFLDTDEMLVGRHGASIASLFEQFGEARFREWEAEVVASALREDQVVIALGGGAVEHAGTREILFGDAETLTVFLEMPLAVALQRCGTDAVGMVRPVLRDVKSLEVRYTARQPFYSHAHLKLNAEANTPTFYVDLICGYFPVNREGHSGSRRYTHTGMSTEPLTPEVKLQFLIAQRPVSFQARRRARLQEWKNAVRAEAAKSWSGAFIESEQLQLTLVYLHDVAPLDTDNLIKPIQDALKGFIFNDDSQIADVQGHKRPVQGVFDVSRMPELLVKGIDSGQECVYVRLTGSKRLEEYL